MRGGECCCLAAGGSRLPHAQRAPCCRGAFGFWRTPPPSFPPSAIISFICPHARRQRRPMGMDVTRRMVEHLSAQQPEALPHHHCVFEQRHGGSPVRAAGRACTRVNACHRLHPLLLLLLLLLPVLLLLPCRRLHRTCNASTHVDAPNAPKGVGAYGRRTHRDGQEDGGHDGHTC